MKNFPAKTAQDEDMREAVQQAKDHFHATGESCYASVFNVLLWHSDRP
ncbi:MAG: hypothetical protein [Caudoviricetes sp.]|nr:MAG: hypothetical protein [Caudoviricetes sp.]